MLIINNHAYEDNKQGHGYMGYRSFVFILLYFVLSSCSRLWTDWNNSLF